MENIEQKNYKEMWDRIVRFITVIITLGLFKYFIDDIDVFDEQKLKIVLYTIVGIAIYYLFIKRITDKHLFGISN